MNGYISKQALLDKTVKRNHIWLYATNAEGKNLKEIVDELPSADVRPIIHGHWGRLTRVENVYSIDGVKTWGIKCQCDKCTFTTIAVEGFGFYDYCPNCGSRNEVEADIREPIGEKGTE